MAYLLSSNCTKNYWNWTTAVEIIVGGWVVSFFLRHSVYVWNICFTLFLLQGIQK